MSEEEYKKFIAPDQVEWDARAVLLRKGIENAKKNAGRVAGYRKLRKFQLIHAVRKQEL